MMEIIAEILWVIVAIWLIHRAYVANKKAEPFTLQYFLDTEKASQGFDAMFEARGFVLGIAMLAMLAYKLFSCGLVCGWI